MADLFDPDDGLAFNGNSNSNDDSMVFDLTDVNEKGNFKPIPPGIYDAIIDSAEYGRSQRSNNPMITWQFKVTSPEGVERTLFYHTVLIETGLPRLKRLLKRAAPDDAELLTQFRPQTDWVKLIGLPIRVRVRTRVYEGEIRNEVADVLPAATEERQTLSFLG